MTTSHVFANRQSGRFLFGWLAGVGGGAALIGIGMYAGFKFLSSTPTQQPQGVVNTAPVASTRTTGSTAQRSNIAIPPRIVANSTVPIRTTDQPPPVPYQPQAAAPSSPAYVRTREGEVIQVPEGETIDMVLDRHAREQNLSVAIDRAVSAAERMPPVPVEVIRQQQERVAAARVEDLQRREQYEQEMRERDQERLQRMLEEDARRGIEPDPDEEGEIAPRLPD